MRTMPISHLLLLSLTFGASVVLVERSVAQEVGQPVVIGERLEIESQILNEARPLIISKPRSYETGEERYPVLYLLDGDVHFHHTTGTINFLAANGRMPEMLVVAIPNTGPTDRTRNLSPPSDAEDAALSSPSRWGGADNFRRFLSDELMPWIEKDYRTRPYSILVGHSLGGLFAIHSLITQPDVFDAYIAISPSLQWDEQRVVAQAEAFFESTAELTADLYMTVGDEGGALLGGVRKLSGVLDEKSPRGFRWGFRVMEDESHNSVPLRSTRQGLESIFDGWSLHDAVTVFDRGGLPAIEEHYRRGGVRFGYDRTTPTMTVMNLAVRLIEADRLEEATEILMRDPETSPAPAVLLSLLADSYAGRDDAERAREFYTLSLKANPGNEDAKRKLAEMGVDVAALVPAVVVAPETLATYVGRYQLSADDIITVRLDEDGQLTTDDDSLLPMSQRKFFLTAFEAELSFNVNAAGEVESLTIHLFGQELLAKRVE